ncbi:MAG: DMT family transporter [Verrucomicrobiales bacterium]|nr:DMT family transporter [Verrucomicrobiales bacterium]
MSRRVTDWRGFVALVIGAACIGIAPLWVRWSEVGPVATAFWRLALSLPFLAALAGRERRAPSCQDARRMARLLKIWLVAAGVLFALDLGTWHLAIQRTSVANACLLANLAPIVVAVGAWWFFAERPDGWFWVAAGLALGGAWWLTGASFSAGTEHWRGDLLSLVTALFYGGYQLCVARLGRDLGPSRLLFISSAISAVALWVYSTVLGETLWPGSARGWGVLLGLALTAQVAGQGLITYGFGLVPAGVASLTLLLQTVVAAVAGWWWLGESLTGAQVAGGMVLLAGLVLARWRQQAAKDRVTARGPSTAPL